MPEMARDNPFETFTGLRYDRREAIQNHGSNVMVHLGVGLSSDTGDDALYVMLDQNEDFDDWLEANKREAFLVPEESVGLRQEGMIMSGSGYIVISKPREWDVVIE